MNVAAAAAAAVAVAAAAAVGLNIFVEVSLPSRRDFVAPRYIPGLPTSLGLVASSSPGAATADK